MNYEEVRELGRVEEGRGVAVQRDSCGDAEVVLQLSELGMKKVGGGVFRLGTVKAVGGAMD